MFTSIWRFRHFVLSAIRADIRNRFANSRMAGFWLLVQPLVQVAIFATILSSVLSSRLPGVSSKYGYAVYLLAGISAWSLFAETLTRCINVFVENASLLKKISFPRICLPLIVVGASVVNFVALLAVTTVFLLAIGAFPGLAYLWLFPLMLLVIALAAGLGVMLGVINVFIRDLGQGMAVLVSIWFWLTPVIYPITVVPQHVASVLRLNPMTPIVEAFHEVILQGRMPNLMSLAPVAALAILLMTLAVVLFKRASPEMVDVL